MTLWNIRHKNISIAQLWKKSNFQNISSEHNVMLNYFPSLYIASFIIATSSRLKPGYKNVRKTDWIKDDSVKNVNNLKACQMVKASGGKVTALPRWIHSKLAVLHFNTLIFVIKIYNVNV